MAFFEKEEIIQRMIEKRAATGDGARADFNLALLILGSALFEKRLKSGEDYGGHPVHVGMTNTRSNTKRIIGILHDVVEDSDWTVGDLRRIGFSERIVSAVDAMTHREGELYFDSIRRCALNKDAVDKKLEDLTHNMDASRNSNFLRDKDVERIHKYMIAHAYLLAVKKGRLQAGSSVTAFAAATPQFSTHAGFMQVAEKYETKGAAPVPANDCAPKKPSAKKAFGGPKA